MSTIYQCDKCGAQSSDAGSISKVDLVDLCKQCKLEWANLKKNYLDEFLGSVPLEKTTKKQTKKQKQTDDNKGDAEIRNEHGFLFSGPNA